MLGTNDSKNKNWVGADRFSGDYRALIEHYQSLPSRPRVILMTPPSAFLVHGWTSPPSGTPSIDHDFRDLPAWLYTEVWRASPGSSWWSTFMQPRPITRSSSGSTASIPTVPATN